MRNHIIMKNTLSKKRVVIPNHKEIKKGTLLAIIEQAGLTKESFISALR